MSFSSHLAEHRIWGVQSELLPGSNLWREARNGEKGLTWEEAFELAVRYVLEERLVLAKAKGNFEWFLQVGLSAEDRVKNASGRAALTEEEIAELRAGKGSYRVAQLQPEAPDPDHTVKTRFERV